MPLKAVEIKPTDSRSKRKPAPTGRQPGIAEYIRSIFKPIKSSGPGTINRNAQKQMPRE